MHRARFDAGALEEPQLLRPHRSPRLLRSAQLRGLEAPGRVAATPRLLLVAIAGAAGNVATLLPCLNLRLACLTSKKGRVKLRHDIH
eukprot:1593441-Pleurochrysis_carterae.AAC.2